jgi:hypothetical protein
MEENKLNITQEEIHKAMSKKDPLDAALAFVALMNKKIAERDKEKEKSE